MVMDQSILRISKELSEIQKTSDLSLAVACRDIDVRNVKALIIGPHETPYEFGFFEFAFRFTKDYPSKAPRVISETTSGGRCRFNPNIYSDGKVCLSILGTWRGESREEWSSAQGLESILLSIQSLMSGNPFENEPGFEDARTDKDKKLQKKYVEKIQHETLRVTIIERLESYLGLSRDGKQVGEQQMSKIERPGHLADRFQDDDEDTVVFEPFKDLCKQRFLWYYESYLAAIEKGKQDATDGTPFVMMPFESARNRMEGEFHYTELERRLKRVKAALDEESETWAEAGPINAAAETRVSVNLKHQYGQVVTKMKTADLPHHIALENDNPFVWVMTYFGRAMTNFDSGVLRIRLTFSPRFPEEQPRVKMETKIFHHLVTLDGTLCYTPVASKREDVGAHLDAMINVLEETEPAFDPRKTVNLEANRLFWSGGPSNKKLYHRKLRRSVQDSLEDFPQ